MFGGNYFGDVPFGDISDGLGTGGATITAARLIPDGWRFRVPTDSEFPATN